MIDMPPPSPPPKPPPNSMPKRPAPRKPPSRPRPKPPPKKPERGALLAKPLLPKFGRGVSERWNGEMLGAVWVGAGAL